MASPYSNDRSRSRFSVLTLVLTLSLLQASCASQTVSAVVPHGGEGAGGEGDSSYASGRVIVKLRAEAAARVRQAWEQWGELTPDHLPFESLRTASERNGIARWEPLLRDVREDDTSGLDRTYVLTLTGEADVLRAVQDFSGLTDLVEYAEPDYIAHTQE